MTSKMMVRIDVVAVVLIIVIVVMLQHRTLLGSDGSAPFIANATLQGTMRGQGNSAPGTTQISGSGQG